LTFDFCLLTFDLPFKIGFGLLFYPTQA